MAVLLVASAGGHLDQLWTLRPRLSELEGEPTWVTFDTPQSRSLLRDEQRIFIPPARSRDGRAAVTHTRLALHILGLNSWDGVVSTGSLPSVPFLALARARGIDCHFIDSATRVTGPSLSGSMLRKVPGIHRYSQHPWPDRAGWHYRGSVFDSYEVEPAPRRPIRRAVVTLGLGHYGFPRLIGAARRVLSPDADVLWQTGWTEVGGLSTLVEPFVAEEDLRGVMAEADVVICHAGVGSALTALKSGHCPVIVPRRQARGEHVDDHQVQLAAELARRGLAIAVEPDELSEEVLVRAASRRAVVNPHPPTFVLGPEPDVVPVTGPLERVVPSTAA